MSTILDFKTRTRPCPPPATPTQDSEATRMSVPTRPLEITDAEFALGAADADRVLPSLDQVPEAFRDQLNQWTEVTARMLEEGISTNHHFVGAPGIDIRAALRHIGAAFMSRCDDARKIAGVAYLMSMWFKYVRIEAQTVASEAGA